MTKSILVLVTVIFFLVPSFGNPILLELAKKEPISSDPGKTITVVIKVKNNSDSKLTLSPSSQLPSGWVALALNRPVEIDSWSESMALFSFLVPKNERPGNFDILYILTDKSIANSVYQLEFPVQVNAINRLSAEALEAPNFIMAGKEIHAKFLVTNLSNSEKTIVLKTNNCKIVSSEKMTLPPKESGIVDVEAKTLGDLTTESRFLLWLEAYLEDDKEVVVYATQHVLVYPREDLKIRPGKVLPVDASIVYMGRTLPDSSFESGYQFDISTNGAIDKEQTKMLGLKIRGPNRLDFTSLGLYPEYFISFSTPSISLFAGDKSFQLSRLTEFSRYGKGVEFEADFSTTSLGGFYMKPTYFPNIKNEMGGYVRLKFNEESYTGINFFRKNHNGELGFSDLVSLNSVLQFNKNTYLEGEFAVGMSQKGKGRGATFSFFSKPLKSLVASANLLYSSRNFPGFYTNTLNYSGMVNYQLVPGLSFTALISQDQSNGDQDTLFSTSPSISRKQAGFAYWLSKHANLNISAQQQKAEDKFQVKKFHYNENVLRMRFQLSFDKMGASITQELGSRNDLLALAGHKLLTVRSTLNASVVILNTSSVEVFGQNYLLASDDDINKRQWLYGIAGNLNFRTKTRLRFSLQNNFTIEDYYLNRNLMNVSLSQTIARNHEFSVTSYYTLFRGELQKGDFYFMSSYRYRLEIPLQPRAETQSVKGRIVDENAQPMEGILLRLAGKTAISDKSGDYSFRFINTGNHHILVDASSHGLRLVPDLPSPMYVEIKTGANVQLDFVMKSAVTVSGKVELKKESSPGQNLRSNATLGPVMMELTNGTEVHRRLTDEMFRFEFGNLRPGTWELKVLKPDLYPGFTFEKEQFSFDIKSGEKIEVTVNVTQKKREIRFQQNMPSIQKN